MRRPSVNYTCIYIYGNTYATMTNMDASSFSFHFLLVFFDSSLHLIWFLHTRARSPGPGCRFREVRQLPIFFGNCRHLSVLFVHLEYINNWIYILLPLPWNGYVYFSSHLISFFFVLNFIFSKTAGVIRIRNQAVEVACPKSPALISFRCLCFAAGRKSW